MGLLELVILAVGLSMDAFAVALCKGLAMRKLNKRNAILIALFFGGFQALMPFLGWVLGKQFEQYITAYDHWIAFGLLLFIGGSMLWDAFKGEEQECCDDHLALKDLFLLAVATSIDALAVGITFAFLQVSILPAIGVIGLITGCLSYLGVCLGNRFGLKYQKKAQIAGGVVLMFIGARILLEHLGIF